MSPRRRLLTVVAVGWVLLMPRLSGSVPQDQVSAEGRAQYQRLQRLLEEIGAATPGTGDLIGWLRGAAMKAEASNVQIADDVVANYQALRDVAVASGELPDDRRDEVRQRIAADLKVKVDYCRIHPRSMAALVDVTIHTLLPDDSVRTEAKQWNVVFLPAVLAAFPDRRGQPFPGVSSPSHRQLPPGNYVVWAEHPSDATRSGPRKEIQVGDPFRPVTTPVVADIFAGK